MASAISLDFAQGVVAGTRFGTAELPPGLEWFDASHPFPNAASEAAGRRALAIAAQCGARGSLLVLLSGGASSMLAVPAPTLTLADKGVTSRALMNAGAPISDLNCVRKHLSAVKGGRLAAAAGRTTTLALSDVHGPVADDPSVIGSGPTVADPTTREEALAIVRRAGVAATIPAPVLAYLERGLDETPKPGDRRLSEASYRVIGNRHAAMDGAAQAARARGYAVRMIEEATSGEAREAGEAFVANGLRDAAASGPAREVPVCIIASGETTVHVRGTGRGGRNQEFALAAIPDARSPRAFRGGCRRGERGDRWDRRPNRRRRGGSRFVVRRARPARGPGLGRRARGRTARTTSSIRSAICSCGVRPERMSETCT